MTDGPAPGGDDARVLLRIEGVTSHYGRIQALHGIELEVMEGELVALVGSNGAGKTTLLKCLSGLQPLSAGRVYFEQQDFSRLAAEQRVKRGISQVPEGRQVFDPLSVADNLRLGAYCRRDEAGIRRDRDRMYELFPVLRERADSPAGNLSGGQQQMLAMARALMARPRLLLLDEPSMGLAPRLVSEVFRIIRQLAAEKTTILLVEQNAMAALQIADRGYVLETGKIVLEGAGQALLDDERVKEAYLGL